jgi:uncharacterized RDD family membrane protein YckC
MQNEEFEYAGFWQRLGAFFLDGIFFLPLIGITLWLSERSRFFNLYYFLPGQIINIWFHIYLVKRFGGTPGKLLLGIRIMRMDSSPMDYWTAFLRYSVSFVISILIPIALTFAAIKITDTDYFSLGFQARFLRLEELAPLWYKPVKYFNNIWVWSEFFVMMTNKKRRAIHDFIAGTIVIKKVSKLPLPSTQPSKDTHLSPSAEQ